MKNVKSRTKIKKNRAKKKKIVRVLAMGTFDLVHPGHLFYLEHAKKHGTHLSVIVARDDTVKRFKKHFPLFDEKSRLKIVSALKVVDRALLGSKTNMIDRVVEVNPQVVVMGYDTLVKTHELLRKFASRGINPLIVHVPAYKPSKFKSSVLKKELRKNKKH